MINVIQVMFPNDIICEGRAIVVSDNCIPTFKVQGQIYHLAGSLLPMPNTEHKFLQINFMGNTDEQIEQRFRYNMGI